MTVDDDVKIVRGVHAGEHCKVIEHDTESDTFWLSCPDSEYGGYTYGPFTSNDLERIDHGTHKG